MMKQDKKLMECIQLCWECRTECQKTLYNYCLDEGGDHAESEHVKLMADCIEICQTAADFMVRNSPLHASVCAACAEVCEECAESCEQIGEQEEDEQMEQCAETCYRCAESCREMGSMRQAA